MKSIQIFISMLLLAYAGINLSAQSDADTVRITYKGKGVTVKPQGDESSTTIKFKDTIAKKNIVVKVSVKDLEEEEDDVDLDSAIKKTIKLMTPDKKKERKFVQTSWLPNFDLGFVSTDNEVESNSAFNPKFTKSANISLGIVKQDLNLYKGRLLFSYGFSINNYYMKYNDRQQIQRLDQQGHLYAYTDTLNTFRKNRLDAHYLTIPVLLEYHSKNNSFNIAAGVEYSFGGRTSLVTKGTFKSLDFERREESEIKINPEQINAVLRIGFDHLAVYGRYTITDMYQSTAYAGNTNPHQHLFSVGICLFGI
jgi:hypothetical protein